MSDEVPDDRRYLATHEWAQETNGTVRVGISDFAQDELGDVVFVELPAEGDDVEHDTAFGVIESIKAVSDLYAPVSGTVVGINDDLEAQPELVNDEPYDAGWMIDIEPADPAELESLLDATAYRDQIA